jgi:hypothetical protein
MKNENITEYDRIIRIVFGLMILILFWFEMVGGINLEIDTWIKFIIIIIGATLLITGVSKFSPLYYILGKKRL